MKAKRIVSGLAVLLVILAAVVLWRSVLFPLGNTANEKDKSFSDRLSSDDHGFAKALTPRKFLFPADHGAHNEYRTEWWYFTGNLKNQAGRKFGYQLTFFRYALSPEKLISKSAWRSNQLYMAHLTLTDVMDDRFYTDERFSRAGSDLAGAAGDQYQVWLYDWSAKTEGAEDFPLRLQANSDRFAIDLVLESQKKPVLQGDHGLSRKSAEPGNASYYYSYTRMRTQGYLDIGGNKYQVSGNSWMDREWSTSSLSKEQIGWDWFALQFSDNSELMFYQFRRKDGKADSNSAGYIFMADNTKVPLNNQNVTIRVTKNWKSPHSKIRYPAQWHVSVPSRNLEADIIPLINDQELNVSYRYWEGAVSITGTKNGKAISGQGYVELTGYQ